jgi:hypothetical protein
MIALRLDPAIYGEIPSDRKLDSKTDFSRHIACQ